MTSTREMEEKWLGRWSEAKAFESNPSDSKPFYLTVAYPYPSGSMHVGHARTYTVPDIIARFKRMQSYNTLFPMGWHVTGTPIIGAVKRLNDREEKQMHVLKNVYKIRDDELKELETPMGYAQYFIKNHYRNSMQRMGYTIDWRRQFTTNDPHYNKFIEWQYKTLHKKGLVKKGLHPVKYCINDKNPVTTHDLLEGEDAEVQEFTLLKFKYNNSFIIAATLRPETVYGQTNLWIDPEVTYVKANVDSEQWIISRECAEKLGYQDKKVKVTGEVKGSDLIGEYCTAPGVDRDIIILPSRFCDTDIGSGLVTSVPSDAPYDWMGLYDLQQSKDLCSKYGLDWEVMKKLEVIPIIKTEEFGDQAALEVCKDMGIKSQEDTEKLEEATKEVYKAGFHTGTMNENCGKYSGVKVSEAKGKVKQELIESKKASTMHEFSEKVRCRCGGKVVVAKVDSWFIDYDNEDWKEVTRACAENLNTIPEKTKNEYLNTIDWLREWPCIRNYGLGTRLPFDDRFMIEPLSDSTIYMSYYTISHLVKELDPENLKPEFFDYVYNKEGSLEEVSKSTGIPAEKLEEIHESFDYWYPQDWRCSALELIQNHLTFMLFHHTALFKREKWPKGIAAFGMGLLEGAKMSSSKGNIISLKDAIDSYGADVVRLFLMGNAEPWQDFDWRETLVKTTAKKLNQFREYIRQSESTEGDTRVRDIDRWIISRLNRIIQQTTEALDGFQTRKALQYAFYDLLNDLSWYIRRTKPNPAVMKTVADTWVRLITPFTPFTCEELWESMGKREFVSDEKYPTVNESAINLQIEVQEDFVRKVMEDLQNILKVTKIQAKTVHLYLSPEWKYKVYRAIYEGKQIKDVMQDPEIKKHGKEVVKLMQTRREELPETLLDRETENKTLEEAKEFLEKEYNTQLTVHLEPDHDPENKARYAQPMKPGIYIEA